MGSRGVMRVESRDECDPVTDVDREELRTHLGRVLASPVFHASKRYASVLRFIVEQTLEGEGAHLKERTIGVEVFQRAPDYDTANNHSVRSAVAEVRKRLAQYYLENPHTTWRIEVVPGSYVPQFRRAAEAPVFPEQKQVHGAEMEPVPANPRQPAPMQRVWPIAAGAIGLASLIAVIAVLWAPDSLNAFWSPILSSPAPVLLCIGNLEGGKGLPGGRRAPIPQ